MPEKKKISYNPREKEEDQARFAEMEAEREEDKARIAELEKQLAALRK